MSAECILEDLRASEPVYDVSAKGEFNAMGVKPCTLKLATYLQDEHISKCNRVFASLCCSRRVCIDPKLTDTGYHKRRDSQSDGIAYDGG